MFVRDQGVPTAVRFGPPPLLTAALGACLGVVLARAGGAAGVALAGAVTLFAALSSRRMYPLALALPAALGALELRARLDAVAHGGPVALDARVVGPLVRDPVAMQVLFALRRDGEASASARAILQLRGGEPPDVILPGDRLRGVGFLRPSSARAGTSTLPVIELELGALRVEHGPPSPERLATQLRLALKAALERRLSPESAGLLAQLVLGVRSSLDDDLVDAHRATGLAHLLAVSGAHATLLAMLLASGYTLLRGREPFRARRFRRVAGLTLVVYGAVTGFEAPVLRAIVAWLLVAIAGDRGRRASVGATLALPALITCFVAPRELFGVGFCLSYAAVIGLAAAHRPGRADTLWNKLGNTLRASAWALLTTTPLTLWWFGQCAPWTLLGTPLLAPLVALMLGLGLTTAILECTLPPLAAPCAALLEPCCHAYTATVHLLARMPGAPLLALRHPSTLELGALVLCAVSLLALWPSRRGLAAACLALCVPFHVGVTPRESPALRMLDVGHGQAALVTTADGRRVLCDCGSGHRPRLAARHVLDAMHGPLGIDVAILTHGDADHIAGFDALAARVRIDRILVPRALAEDRLVGDLVARGATLEVLDPGSWSEVLPGFRVYAPSVPDDATSNEHSLWTIVGPLRGDTSGLRIVMPGDAEGRNLDDALRAIDLARTDVLVLPHHGRGDAEPNRRLLELAAPRIALASCREQEDPPLAALARAHGTTVLTTGDAGTITIHLDGSDRIETERWPRLSSSAAGETR